MKNLYILRGVPGAGKSTLAASLGFPTFEADQFHMKDGVYKFDPSKIWLAHKSCQERLEKAMIKGEPNLIVSNTSTTNKEVQIYIDLAAKHGYTVFSLIVENRHGNKNVHNVPDAKILEMAEKLKNSIQIL